MKLKTKYYLGDQIRMQWEGHVACTG